MANDLYDRLGVQKKPVVPPESNDQDPPNPTEGGDQNTPTPQPPQTPPAGEEETEEELLAKLKRINPNIGSLEDIRAVGAKPEDEAQKKKKRQNEVLAFALSKELVTREEYDQYQQDSAKPPRQIVFEDYKSRREAQGASPEKIEKEFAKLWHEDVEIDEGPNADQELPIVIDQRKRDMDDAARRIIRKKHSKVFGLEKEYDNHVSTVKSQQERDNNLLQALATYRTDLDAIVSSVSTVSKTVGDTESGDTEEITFEYKKDVLDQVRNEFLNQSIAAGYLHNYSKDVLESAVQLRIQVLTEDQRINHAVKTFHSKKLKKLAEKRRELVPDDISGSGSASRGGDERLRQRVKSAGFLPE